MRWVPWRRCSFWVGRIFGWGRGGGGTPENIQPTRKMIERPATLVANMTWCDEDIAFRILHPALGHRTGGKGWKCESRSTRTIGWRWRERSRRPRCRCPWCEHRWRWGVAIPCSARDRPMADRGRINDTGRMTTGRLIRGSWTHRRWGWGPDVQESSRCVLLAEKFYAIHEGKLGKDYAGRYIAHGDKGDKEIRW